MLPAYISQELRWATELASHAPVEAEQHRHIMYGLHVLQESVNNEVHRELLLASNVYEE